MCSLKNHELTSSAMVWFHPRAQWPSPNPRRTFSSASDLLQVERPSVRAIQRAGTNSATGNIGRLGGRGLGGCRSQKEIGEGMWQQRAQRRTVVRHVLDLAHDVEPRAGDVRAGAVTPARRVLALREVVRPLRRDGGLANAARISVERFRQFATDSNPGKHGGCP